MDFEKIAKLKTGPGPKSGWRPVGSIDAAVHTHYYDVIEGRTRRTYVYCIVIE